MGISTGNSAVLSFPEYQEQAQRLAETIHLPCLPVVIHTFPDGESRVCLPEKLPEHVIVCRSLNEPNNKLIELALVADTARTLGAKSITLIAPYLCYMRQDIAFHPGEAISQQIIGKLLANYFDHVITVDSHLHRISKLEQAVPASHAINKMATSLFSDFIQTLDEQPVLMGPDAESEQWVSCIASPSSLEYGIASKTRLGDKQVEITLPKLDVQNRTVILVDDMASTGRTLAKTAKLLYQSGARVVHALVTHALFVGDAEQTIQDAGIQQLWSTDSVPHDSNVIPLAPLLAQALQEIE